VSLRKTKINRSNRISSPEEEEEKEKERGKKNLRKNEREMNKDPPHHVDACVCVCVLFLLLCPRLNVRLQMCVDELCCFRQSFIQKVGGSSLREKSYSKRKLQKKNSRQPTTLQIYSHKSSSSSSSVDVHGYTKTLT
jgi:hypothetical protein